MSAKQNWTRIALAGPGAVIVALVIMAGMALWLPGGAAGIDNLVLPLVFVPLIWAALFFHACLDRRIGRVALVAGALFAAHAILITAKFVNHPAATNEAQP